MSAVQLIVYLLVAALAGLIAERLVGTGLPGGIAGTILAALLGIWLMVRVLGLVIPGDLDLAGVPVLTAILGATLVLVTYIVLMRVVGPFRNRRWRR